LVCTLVAAFLNPECFAILRVFYFVSPRIFLAKLPLLWDTIKTGDLMKNLIFRLLNIPARLQQSFRQGEITEQVRQAERQKNRTQVNYPTGSKVMVISNSPPQGPDEVLVATVSDYQDFGHSLLPVLTKDSGEEFMTMGKIIHYDENRHQVLSKLTWWERWNVVTEFGPSLTKQEATNLEAGRPAWDNGEASTK
jgi:hypothetical protein